MSTLSDRTLGEMVEAVVKEVDPERVYLFGSHARGEGKERSDVDLLVVERDPFGPTRIRRAEMVRPWQTLARFRVAKDILVFSVDEVEQWGSGRNHVIAHALREGRLLYERP